ncbi:hypothetical protein [Snodgrassella sp. ESL0253]|uniref:hypothetical protein n=1 Tax=Snodgrassella sp. ESL0253 TaxID=2705031 RepID=UPI00158165E6|nr:hypothetical protein [Snodgrassella sp. ESL0253]
MANLKETSFWEEGIYQWETSDPVLGGENGIDNVPTRQLANRTKWLKDNKLDKSATATNAEMANRACIADRLTDARKMGGVAFDGSADIDLPGVNKPGNQNTSGNADTASRLLLPKHIGGKVFDGTADIHLPVSAGYVSTEKYESGDLIKVDGDWYECYHPDGCKGKDPRDPLHRPSGWQNSDQSQPYYWLKIGRWLAFPETGSAIYLPTTNIREGLIKYRNDGNLHKDKFWRLATLYPHLILNNYIQIADLRGEFLRGLDDNRGIDDWGRVIFSAQGDAIRDITGSFSGTVFGCAGAFSLAGYKDAWMHFGEGTYFDRAIYNFAASSVVPTALENRPRNIAMLIATRI